MANGHSYHNIEPYFRRTRGGGFKYTGYAADGTKYYATGQWGNYRWAQAITMGDGKPPYFYTKTLAQASAKLEGIGA